VIFPNSFSSAQDLLVTLYIFFKWAIFSNRRKKNTSFYSCIKHNLKVASEKVVALHPTGNALG
jgi:hypothetical protein